MSSKPKRKVTVESSHSSKESSEQSSRRPSVFERLGPNAVNVGSSQQERHSRNSGTTNNDPTTEKCRNWLRSGSCSYGSSCRYQHALPAYLTGSPKKSEKNIDEKDLRHRVRSKRKGRKKSASPSPKRSKSSNSSTTAHTKKSDLENKMKSTVVVTRNRSSADELETSSHHANMIIPPSANQSVADEHAPTQASHPLKKTDHTYEDDGRTKEKPRQTPEKAFPEWPMDASQLDYKEELTLEMTRQQLKRELELELQKEEKAEKQRKEPAALSIPSKKRVGSSSSSSRSSSSSNSSGSGTASSSSDTSSSSSSDDSDDSSSSSSSSSSSTSSRGKRNKRSTSGANQKMTTSKSSKHSKDNGRSKESVDSHVQRDRPKSRSSISGVDRNKSKHRSQSKEKNLSARLSRKHSNSPPNEYSYSKKSLKDKSSPGRGKPKSSLEGTQAQSSRRESRARGTSKSKSKNSNARSTSNSKRAKDWPSSSNTKDQDESASSRRHKKKKSQNSKDKGFRPRRSPVKAPSEMSPTSRLWASRHKRQPQIEDPPLPPRSELLYRDSNKENKQQDNKDHRRIEQSPLRKGHRSISPSMHHSGSKAEPKIMDSHYRNQDSRKSDGSQNRHGEDSRSQRKDSKHSLSPAMPSSTRGRSPKEDVSKSRGYGGPSSKDNSRAYPLDKRDTSYPPPPPPPQSSNIYKWVRNRDQVSPPRDRSSFPSTPASAGGNRREPSPDHRKRPSETIGDKAGRRSYEKPREESTSERRREPRKAKDDAGKKKDRSSSWDRDKKRGEPPEDHLNTELDQAVNSRSHPHDDHRKVDVSRRPREGDLPPYALGPGVPLRQGELDKERDLERRRRGPPPDELPPKHYREGGPPSPPLHPMMSPPRGRRSDSEKIPPYPKSHKSERLSDREDLPPPLPPHSMRREHRYPGDIPPHMRDPRDPDYLPLDHCPPHHPMAREGRDPRMDPRDMDPRDHPPLPRSLPADFSPDRYPDYRYGEREMDRYGRRIKEYDLPPLHRDDHMGPDPRDHYPGYRRDDYYGELLPHEHWDAHYGRSYPPSHHDMLPPLHHSPPPPPMYRGRGEPPDRPLDRYRDHIPDIRPEGRITREGRPPRHRSPDWPNRREDRWSGTGPPPSPPPVAPAITANVGSPVPPPEVQVRATSAPDPPKPSPSKRERGREGSPGSHGSWEHNSRHGSQSSEGHRSSSSSSQKKDESKGQPQVPYPSVRPSRHDRIGLKSSSTSKSRKRSRSKTPTFPPPPPGPSHEADSKKTRSSGSSSAHQRPVTPIELEPIEKPPKEAEKSGDVKETPDVSLAGSLQGSLTNSEPTPQTVDAVVKHDKPIKDISNKKEMPKGIELPTAKPATEDKDSNKQERIDSDKEDKEAALSDWSDDDDDELLIRDDVTEIDDFKASSDDDKESSILKSKSDTQSDTFSIKSSDETSKENRRSQSLERPPKEHSNKRNARREGRNADDNRNMDAKVSSSEKEGDRTEGNSGDEESVDYDPISDDEFDALIEESEGDGKTASGENALDVDWSSLQQLQTEKTRSIAGSTRKRFTPAQILKRIGISTAWAGPTVTKKLLEVCGKEEAIKLEHPIAAFHLATVRAKEKRSKVLQQMGPFRQALCARQDLWIRRQLCKTYALPKTANITSKNVDAFGFSTTNIDKDLFKLSLELLNKPKTKTFPPVCAQ